MDPHPADYRPLTPAQQARLLPKLDRLKGHPGRGSEYLAPVHADVEAGQISQREVGTLQVYMWVWGLEEVP